jgi:hypothetical protein
MNIGTVDFATPTFEQSNPGISASEAINKMINEGIQTYYAQPMAQQDLAKAQYNNQILGAQAQYAQPNAQYNNQILGAQAQYAIPMAKADLGYKEAQIPYLGSETNLNNIEAQYTPQKYALQQQMMTYRNQRFGQGQAFYRLFMATPPNLRATLIAQHPDDYQAMIEASANQALNSPVSQGGYGLSQGNNSIPQQSAPVPIGNPAMASRIAGNKNQYNLGVNNPVPNQSQIPNTQYQIPVNANNATTGQYPIPVNNTNNNLPQNSLVNNNKPNYFHSTPDQINQLQSSAQMLANKGLTSPKLTDRYQQGLALGNLLNEPKVNDMFNVLAKYSGLQGSANAQIDRFSNPQDFADYQSAKVQLPAIISGGIKMIEGMPTSDAGMKSAYSAFKMAQDLVGTNPDAAMKYYNNGKQLVDAELASLQKAANPVFNVNRITPSVPFSLNSKVPRGTSNGMVRVLTPDGRRLKISQSNLQSALKMGAKVI